MRISDWSSDVCSSDLEREALMGHPGFFDVDDRLARLSGLGDQLEGFGRAVDFGMFRPDLVSALGYGDGAQGGRPPFDPSSEERRVGKECVSTCRSLWTPYN